ncbi:hypothetical protein QBC35DRAFT_504354 [Podospora australis]|uniref:Apple domain-containing protein n=1 Tax=Podospora australis TaxID=1536484 RepID=A0AAN7AGK8_9PEZI|nr:hypothetical protein QBC35DRAFT_504354 [Podospora australis]
MAANNYPSPQTPYSDGLIPNENPYTAYPQVQVAKPEHTYNPDVPQHSYQPPAYQPPLDSGYHAEGVQRPFWKRSVTWVSIVSIIIIAILAGLLGAVATGSIKTAGNSSSSNDSAAVTAPVGSAISSSTPTSSSVASAATTPISSTETAGPTPTTLATKTTSTETQKSATPSPPTRTVTASDGESMTLECPGVQGLDFAIDSPTRGQLLFRRECDVNYPDGDTKPGFGKIKTRRISSLTECIEACAELTGCMGVVFNTGPECWLKHTIIGPKRLDGGNEVALIVQ